MFYQGGEGTKTSQSNWEGPDTWSQLWWFQFALTDMHFGLLQTKVPLIAFSDFLAPSLVIAMGCTSFC